MDKWSVWKTDAPLNKVPRVRIPNLPPFIMIKSTVKISVQENTTLLALVVKGKIFTIYPKSRFRDKLKMFEFEKYKNGFHLHLGLFGLSYINNGRVSALASNELKQ